MGGSVESRLSVLYLGVNIFTLYKMMNCFPFMLLSENTLKLPETAGCRRGAAAAGAPKISAAAAGITKICSNFCERSLPHEDAMFPRCRGSVSR